ncbi:hypothetical protein [Candidatus Chloroploca sp. Khr17]|uniref:hypothetical protein n=1 Tax=Candidatus Chloroploca sp. Khr17 TaxID=2496869 RepID=UPI0013ECB8B6|nr:hypothetical protein [Candidatus Chloroploca sp. Khr17]
MKPLYYRCDERRFVFASEVKAFLALDRSTPNINLAYLATSISTQQYLLSTPQTLLQDVKRLEAGHSLIRFGNLAPNLQRRSGSGQPLSGSGFTARIRRYI